MSTISSGPTTEKYQRLQLEYRKLRGQVTVLKDALIAEQTKTTDLQNQLVVKDGKIRRLTNDNEGIIFRNDQLLKRVETLQKSLDSNTAAFALAKGKKKHKEMNLRIFGENSRNSLVQAQTEASPLVTIEQELERKIEENEILNSRLYDIEQQHEATVKELFQRIADLENSNLCNLRNSSILSPPSSISGSSTCNENGSVSNSTTDQNDENIAKQETARKTDFDDEATPVEETNGKFDTPRKNSISESVVELEKKIDDLELENKLLRETCNFVPFSTPIGVAQHEASVMNFDKALEEKELYEHHYKAEASKLAIRFQYSLGRAKYYKKECENLIKREIANSKASEGLNQRIHELELKCRSLNESLEATRTNYEIQMRGLYEHVAVQDAKIIEQAENLMKRNQNCTNNNSSSMPVEESTKPKKSWFSSK